MENYNLSRRNFLSGFGRAAAGVGAALYLPAFLTGCRKEQETRLWIPGSNNEHLQVYPANVSVKPIPVRIGDETINLSGVSVTYPGSDFAGKFTKQFGVFYKGGQWVLIEDPTNELEIDKGKITMQGILTCLNTGVTSSANVDLGLRGRTRLVKLLNANAGLRFADANGEVGQDLSAVTLDSNGSYVFMVAERAENSDNRGVYVVDNPLKNLHKKGRDITFNGRATTKVSELESILGGTLDTLELYIEDPNANKN